MWTHHGTRTLTRRRQPLFHRAALGAVLACGVAVAALHGQEPPARERRPLLDQLNRETQVLYDEAVHGLVRVQLPAPRWADASAQRAALLKRWPSLSEAVKRELNEGPDTPPGAATRPATAAPAAAADGEGDAGGDPPAVVVVPPPAAATDPERDAIVGGRLAATTRPAEAFEPNNIGLLLDDQGHVLVPLHIEAEVVGREGVRAAGPDGVVRRAAFVGCDRQTNVTVLKLELPADGEAEFNGTAVRLSRQHPADGSLVMYIEPHDGSGRLGVWTGAAGDLGIVFTTAGEAAGITRYGQFLNGSACRLIADQIIRYGKVKRAVLGVIISEIREDDPLRRRVPVLGSRTAMRIDKVIPGSPAQQAGLRAGDLLLSLAGEAVEDIPSLAAAIAIRTGKTELQILRDGKITNVVVELRQE
jgi:hypothetical protein